MTLPGVSNLKSAELDLRVNLSVHLTFSKAGYTKTGAFNPKLLSARARALSGFYLIYSGDHNCQLPRQRKALSVVLRVRNIIQV